MQQPEMKYYAKDIPESPVYINGTPLRFEVLETSDAVLIRELDNCIANHRGGVSSITKEQYDEAVKKKPSGIRSESVFRQNQHRQELSAMQFQNLAVADGAVKIGGVFAKPQEREHKPHNHAGLPNGAAGPSGGKPMPDPIEVPTTSQLTAAKPQTAKLSDLT